MATEFASRAIVYLHNKDFEGIVRNALKDIFGEPLASSVIFQIGGTESIMDPSLFEKKIRLVFGPGADLILDYVVKKLENPKKRIVRK
ncbi:MAG: hypothetical protein ABC585_02490 [Candidatus Methanosuratincola petrocarbonis]